MTGGSSFFVKNVKRCRYLYLMLLPVIVYYIIFHYVPMYGAQIAFKDFNPYQGFWDSQWVGLKNFELLFTGPYFWRLLRNTLIISFYSLIFGFPAPIILALLLNEVRQERIKRTIQTVIYMPHFVSIVVVCGMISSFTALRTGLINKIIVMLGGHAIQFMAEPGWFRTIYVSSGIWQEIGWGTIIYLAAIAGLDVALYEAAIVDGANRFQRIWHITLPSLLPTITILLILRLGHVMSVGFEKILLLYNDSTFETADVISTFVYRKGIMGADFSFATAVGLFNSICNFLLIIFFNKVSRRVGETSLW